MDKKKNTTIDKYICNFPKEIQYVLNNMRRVIREAAPEAQEAMSYGMPTFKLKGNLVHFAAFKNHIGFYPTPSAMEAFKKELASYETSRGTIRFPLGKPVPLRLIKQIVEFRVNEISKSKAIK